MFQKKNIQEMIISRVHTKNDNMIQNMDAHVHAVNKGTCRGICVLSFLRRITISQISTFVISC